MKQTTVKIQEVFEGYVKTFKQKESTKDFPSFQSTYVSHRLRNEEYSSKLPIYKLQLVLNYIDNNLDGNIGLSEIAQQIGMSKYYFCRLFKKSMGITPYQYVIQQRVYKAKQLLLQPEMSIVDIALQCGFNSHSHLTTYFRLVTGITPKAYRKQNDIKPSTPTPTLLNNLKYPRVGTSRSQSLN